MVVTRPGVAVSAAAVAKDFPALGPRSLGTAVELCGTTCGGLPASAALTVDGQRLVLVKGTHFFASAAEMVAAEGAL